MNIVDCLVHPAFRHPDDLRRHMREPWSDRPFPGPERYFYPAPSPRRGPDSGGPRPGASPEALLREMDDHGVRLAILLPLTRGLQPDLDLGSAICAGTNRWLAETWLGPWNQHGRFRGTIRVNAADPEAAITEIEAWASHPAFVQIGVPLEALHPYGQRMYHPVWEAAAAHDLPVAVAIDGGSGVDLFPTAAGYPRHHIEYSALAPLNYAYHLVSFIAEGVFARYPRFRVVFTDGGADMAAPLIWRMDKDWRPTQSETPWVDRLPSTFLKPHVRFITHPLQGPRDPGLVEGFAHVSDEEDLSMYGSRYPHWDYQAPDEAAAGRSAAIRAGVLGGTATEFYRLGDLVLSR